MNTKIILMVSIIITIFCFLVYRECFGNVNQYPTVWLFSFLWGGYLSIMFGVRLEILRSKCNTKD